MSRLSEVVNWVVYFWVIIFEHYFFMIAIVRLYNNWPDLLGPSGYFVKSNFKHISLCSILNNVRKFYYFGSECELCGFILLKFWSVRHAPESPMLTL